jgi:hypothetical protein
MQNNLISNIIDKRHEQQKYIEKSKIDISGKTIYFLSLYSILLFHGEKSYSTCKRKDTCA